MTPWNKKNRDKKDIVVVKRLADFSTNLQGAICPPNGKAYSMKYKQKVALGVAALAMKHGGINCAKSINGFGLEAKPGTIVSVSLLMYDSSWSRLMMLYIVVIVIFCITN